MVPNGLNGFGKIDKYYQDVVGLNPTIYWTITYSLKRKRIKLAEWMAKAMVLWLRQMDHDQEAVGLKPGTVYWMDVSKASYYIQENNKNKVTSGMGLTKKKYLKNAKWGTPKKIWTIRLPKFINIMNNG
jgi:hypothetical protein